MWFVLPPRVLTRAGFLLWSYAFGCVLSYVLRALAYI